MINLIKIEQTHKIGKIDSPGSVSM